MKVISLLVSSSYHAAVSRHKVSSPENTLINNSICLLLLLYTVITAVHRKPTANFHYTGLC